MPSPIGPNTFFPYPDSKLYPNTFMLSGIRCPGKWTLTSADRVFGWQINQSIAQDGATVSPKGNPLVVAKFSGELWDEFDVALFKRFRQQFLGKGVLELPGGLLSAGMGIAHPELTALGVFAVVVQKVTPLIDTGGCLWTCEIEFLQHRPPAVVQKKPTQDTPPTGPPFGPEKNLQEVNINKARRTLAKLTVK